MSYFLLIPLALLLIGVVTAFATGEIQDCGGWVALALFVSIILAVVPGPNYSYKPLHSSDYTITRGVNTMFVEIKGEPRVASRTLTTSEYRFMKPDGDPIKVYVLDDYNHFGMFICRSYKIGD